MNAPVQSPFLPGTFVQYAWDSTSLGYLKTCPRLYQYIMIEGWQGKDENIHLRFGIEYHQALADYDIAKAKGIGHDRAVRSCVTDLLVRTIEWKPDRETKAGKYKHRMSLLRTVCWYLEQFRDDPAQTLILDNGKPAVELSFRFELDWGPKGWRQDGEYTVAPYLLSGHLDRVVIYSESLYVMDRKTTTMALSSYYFSQFQPNNQMTLYSTASQIVVKSPVRGVIIDGAQLLMEESRYQRDFTMRTKDQISEWLVDLRYHLAIAETYATNKYWPQNDTACGNYGGCKFRGICSKSPSVRKTFLKADFIQLPEEERWNPLKPR